MKKDIFGSFLVLGAFALIVTSCQKDAQNGSSVKASSNNNSSVLNVIFNYGYELDHSFDIINNVYSISPCLDEGYFQRNLGPNPNLELVNNVYDYRTFKYTEKCTKNTNFNISIDEIKTFKLCHKADDNPKNNDTWKTSPVTCNIATSDEIKIHNNKSEIFIGDLVITWPIYKNDTAYQYSLDIKRTHGNEIPELNGCINASIIQNRTSVAFDGTCYSLNPYLIWNLANVNEIRVCASNNGFKEGEGTQCSNYAKNTYNKSSDKNRVFLNFENTNQNNITQIEGSEIDISINKSNNSNYEVSLDLIPKTGAKEGPCINAGHLPFPINQNVLNYKFNGTCLDGKKNYKISEISKFQVCYRIRDNSDKPWKCTEEKDIIDKKVNFVIP